MRISYTTQVHLLSQKKATIAVQIKGGHQKVSGTHTHRVKVEQCSSSPSFIWPCFAEGGIIIAKRPELTSQTPS